MSYILEALADSEQARLQIAAAPRYSLLPVVGEEKPRARVWPYALAGALLVNAAVLQLWLRPAAPGGVVSINAPAAPQRADNALPVAQPRALASGRSDKPAADLGAPAPEARPAPSQPVPAYALRAAPAPAAALSKTAAANVAGDSAPMQLQKFPPKVTAKRKAEPAALGAAVPAVAAKVASAAAGAATAAPRAAQPTAGLASVAATAPAAPASAPATELPPALQQELPVLAVAGFIRDEGSSSLVIVNDRLAREGDEVAPGVKLEKIVGDSLVFNYKGYRFKR